MKKSKAKQIVVAFLILGVIGVISCKENDPGPGAEPTIMVTLAGADANNTITAGEGTVVEFTIVVTSGSPLVSVTNGTDVVKSYTDSEKEDTFTFSFTAVPGTSDFTFVITDNQNRTALSEKFQVLGLGNGPVTIENPSFESPTLNADSPGNKEIDFTQIPGWILGANADASYGYAGTENRTTKTLTATDGDNFCFVSSGAYDFDSVAIYNTTDHIIFDTEKYTLTYDLYNLYGAYDYKVILYYLDDSDNRVELASKIYKDVDLDGGYVCCTGLKQDETFDVTIADAAAKGKKIGIGLVHYSVPAEVNYWSQSFLAADNFRLDVEY